LYHIKLPSYLSPSKAAASDDQTLSEIRQPGDEHTEEVKGD